MMTETDLSHFYGGTAVWNGLLDETERMFLRQWHAGCNNRTQPDPEEQARRAVVWAGIQAKLNRRRGNVYGSSGSDHR